MAMQVTPFVEPVNLVPYANQFVANVAGAQMDAQKAALEITQMGETLQRQRELYPIELAKAKIAQETMQLELNRAKAMNSVEMLKRESEKIQKTQQADIRRLDDENRMLDIEKKYGPALGEIVSRAITSGDGARVVTDVHSVLDSMREDERGLYIRFGQFSPVKVKAMLVESMLSDFDVAAKKRQAEEAQRAATFADASKAARLKAKDLEFRAEDLAYERSKTGGSAIVDIAIDPTTTGGFVKFKKGVSGTIESILLENLSEENLTPEHKDMLGYLHDLIESTPDNKNGLLGWFSHAGIGARSLWNWAFEKLPFTGTARQEAVKAYITVGQLASKMNTKDPKAKEVAALALRSYLTDLRQLSPGMQEKKGLEATRRSVSRQKERFDILQGQPADDFSPSMPPPADINNTLRSGAVEKVILDGKEGRVVQ